jgi:hypothetical protein
MRLAYAVAFFLTAGMAGGAAIADASQSVDLVLVLLVDVSGSISASDLDLQRRGYAAAFREPDLARAIALGPSQAIAVSYVEWAGPEHQEVIVPCTVLASRNDALRLSRALATSAPTSGQGTSISAALIFAAELYKTCPVAAARLVIDVSGNGPNNIGPDILAARDAVLATGATINGLPVAALTGVSTGSSVNGDWLDAYYESCVSGGPGAFVLPVDDPSRFAATILRKLITEIALSPERLYYAGQERRAPFDCYLIGQRPGR